MRSAASSSGPAAAPPPSSPEPASVGRDLPDVAGVAADRAIGREPADPRGIQHGPPGPLGMVAEGVVDAALGCRVGGEIGGDHEVVVMPQIVEQRLHLLPAALRETAGGDLMQGLAQGRLRLYLGAWLVAVGTLGHDLRGGQTEDEDVVDADP